MKLNFLTFLCDRTLQKPLLVVPIIGTHPDQGLKRLSIKSTLKRNDSYIEQKKRLRNVWKHQISSH